MFSFRYLILMVFLLFLMCQKANHVESLSLMIPPWFAPDASRESVMRAFEEYDSTNGQLPLEIRFGPGKSNLLWQKILLMNKENRLPDMILFKTAWTADLVAKGILRPFPSTLGDSLKSRLMPELIDLVYRNSRLWAAPYDLDIRLIHYRRDLFDSLGIAKPDTGWSLEECIAAAVRLTEDIDGDGLTDRWGLGVPAARSLSTVAQILPFIWTTGGSLKQSHGWKIDQTSVEQALALYRDLKDSLRISPPDLHMLEQADVFNGIATGRFGMTIGGSWEIRMLERMSTYGDRIAQAPLPSIDGNRAISSTDGWSFGLTTDATQKDLHIIRFIYILTGDDHQRAKLAELGWLPVLKCGIPWVEEILGPEVRYGLESYRSVPGGRGWMRTALSITDALQEVLSRDISPRDALLGAQQGLEDPSS